MPRSTARQENRQHSALRRRGTMVAIGLGVLFAALLGGLIVRGVLTQPDAAPLQIAEDVEPPAPAPGTRGQPGIAGPMKGVRVDLLDRSHPDRLVGELILGSMEPVRERHYAVVDPKAYVFLDDGSMVHIQSDRGTMYMPDVGREPESGRLYENVIIRLYDPHPEGKRAEVERDEPRATLRTDSLHFDLSLSELSTPDHVDIRAPELDGQITGLRAIVSESLQRLERLETVRDGHVVFRPGAVPPRAKATPPPPPAPTAPPVPRDERRPLPSVEVLPPPPEAFYAATFQDSVSVVREGQRITSDALDLWVRLIEGALPENAVGRVRISGMRSAAPAGGEAGDAGPAQQSAGALIREEAGIEAPRAAARDEQREPASAAVAPEVETSADDDVIIVSWSGPAVIALVDDEPVELARDHLAMRFTSEEDRQVIFVDDESGAEAKMTVLDYLATTRRMAFAGPGDDGASVHLPGAGTMTGGRILSNLGTGLIQIIGPGTLMPEGEGEERSAMSIRARDRSAFVLKMEDDVLLTELEQALFEGDVRLASDDAMARAEFARADFITMPQRANTLIRLILEDDAQMEMREGESLRGDRIDVAFQPSEAGGQPDPTRVTAVGNVRLQRGDERMEAAFLESSLGRDDTGRLGVTQALLRGHEVVIARGQGDGLSRITGPEMRIDGRERVLEVVGAGRFDHSDGDARIEATWKRSMVFDDLAGIVVAEGQATAESRPGLLSLDRAAGERITLHLSPAMEGSARELLTAGIDGPDGGRALFESRTWADDELRTLQEVRYLEGARIIADNQQGRLHVPVPGRLLLVDHRPEGGERAGDEISVGGPAMRGSSLVDWEGSLQMDRSTGLIEVNRDVRITHRRLDDGELVNLTCDRLIIETAEGDDGGGTQLVAATAHGSVRMTRGTGETMQELTADVAHYSAGDGIIQALSREGDVVTLLDPAALAPVTARAIIWNIVTDDVRIVEPAQVVVPR